MIKIKNEELLKEMMFLTEEETIFLNLEEDISNIMQLIDFQIKSYENLFLSYINNTTEEACNLHLQAFLNHYSDLYIKKNELMNNELMKNIGIESYKYLIETKMKYSFNLQLNKIEITK